MKKVLLAVLLVGIFSLVSFAGTPSMSGKGDFDLTFDEEAGLGMEESLRYGRFDLSLTDEATDGTGYYIKVRFPFDKVVPVLYDDDENPYLPSNINEIEEDEEITGGYLVHEAYAYHTFSLTEGLGLTGYFGRYEAVNSDYFGFWNEYSPLSTKHDGIALELAGTSGDISYGVTPFLYVIEETDEASSTLGVDLLANVDFSGVTVHVNVLGITEDSANRVVEVNGLIPVSDFVDLPGTIELFGAYKTESNFATNTVNTGVSVDFEPIAVVNELTMVMEEDKDPVMTEEFDVSYAFSDAYAVGIYGKLPFEEDGEYTFEPYFSASYDALSYLVYLDFYVNGESNPAFGTKVSFSF